MVMSMTGYGRGEASAAGIDVVVELKSVNHRYFEFSARMPRVYSFLEDRLKTLFQQRIARGKVDAFVSIDTAASEQTEVTVNHALAAGYLAAVREISAANGIPAECSAYDLARLPDVLSVQKQELDETLVWDVVRTAAEEALSGFLAMREAEGQKLRDDVESRVALILKKVEFIEARSPETVRQYRERLEARVKELLGDVKVDEQRLLTETAVFADKVAVAEETVRLRSHIKQLCDLLRAPGAVGRKLDFLVQEMNREANTIGSKSQDLEIAHTVVDIKAEVEKIREQVQNIE